MMTITVGYKHDPIKSSKLRMTVYFNVRRLFLESGFVKTNGVSVRRILLKRQHVVVIAA